MDHCAAASGGAISNLPAILSKPIASTSTSKQLFCKSRCPFLSRQKWSTSGLKYCVNSSERPTSTTPGETWPYNREKLEPDGVKGVRDSHLDEKEEGFGTKPNEEQQEEGVFSNITSQVVKVFQDFDPKFSFGEYYPLLAYGGGGIVAFLLAAAILDAIDSIPLFPKLMELVGLGFTVWFSSRYLIFKENRDELVGKIEQVKKQMLGSEEE